MGSMAQIRTVTNLSSLRIAVNVLLSAFYLFSSCQSSSAGDPLSGMLAAQAVAAPSSAETTANRVRLAEGEYKVPTERGIGPFLRRSMASASPGLCGDWPTEPLKSTEPEATVRLRSNLIAINLSPTFLRICGCCS